MPHGKLEMSNSHAEELLEQSNRQRSDVLADKVAYLKTLAIDVRDEAGSQNRCIDDHAGQGQFEHLQGLITGGYKTVNRVVLGGGRQQRKVICYIAGGIIALFFLFWIVRKFY